MTIPPKTNQELDAMREGGKRLNEILEKVDSFAVAGKTLKEIDTFIHTNILALDGKPSFLGYQNYPAASCLSVNDAVVHGVPTEYELKDTDILGIDVGFYFEGMHTDAAFTKLLGSGTPAQNKLLQTTQEALRSALESAIAGNRVGDIGKTIEEYVQSQGAFGIIRDLAGHGVGRKLQEPPEVLNYRNRSEILLINGMTLAIEPMISMGGWHVYIDSEDNWTVRTDDGSLAAQFETTIIIQDNDPEILVHHPLTRKS